MEAAVETRSGSKLTIYDGLFEGTNANIFNYKGGDIQIFGGKFNPRKTDKVIVGSAARNHTDIMPYRVVMNGHYGVLGLPVSAFSAAFARGAKLFNSSGKEIPEADYETRFTDGSTIYVKPVSPLPELSLRFADTTVGESGKIEWAPGSSRWLIADGGEDYFPKDSYISKTTWYKDYYEWVFYDASSSYATGQKDKYGLNTDYVIITTAENELDLAWIEPEKLPHTSEFAFTPGMRYRVLCRHIIDFRGEGKFYAESPLAKSDEVYIPKMDIPKVTLGNLHPTWTRYYGDKLEYDLGFTVSGVGSNRTELRLYKKDGGERIPFYDAPNHEFCYEITKNGVNHTDIIDFNQLLTVGEDAELVACVSTYDDNGTRYTGEMPLEMYVPQFVTTTHPSYDTPEEMDYYTTISLARTQYIKLNSNIPTDSPIKSFRWFAKYYDATTGTYSEPKPAGDSDNYYLFGNNPGEYYLVAYYDKAQTQPAYFSNRLRILDAEATGDGKYAYLSVSGYATRANPALVSLVTNNDLYETYDFYYITDEGTPNEQKHLIAKNFTESKLSFPNINVDSYNLPQGVYTVGCTAYYTLQDGQVKISGETEITPVSVTFRQTPDTVDIAYMCGGKEAVGGECVFDTQHSMMNFYLSSGPVSCNFSNVEWSSSDESVVTVDNGGRAAAVAPGTATLSVSFIDAAGRSFTRSMDVTVPVSDVDLYVNAPALNDRINANSISVQSNRYYQISTDWRSTYWMQDSEQFYSERYFDANHTYEAFARVKTKGGYIFPQNTSVKDGRQTYDEVDPSKINYIIHLNDGTTTEPDAVTSYEPQPWTSVIEATYAFPILENANQTYLSDVQLKFNVPAEDTMARNLSGQFTEPGGHTYMAGVKLSIKEGLDKVHFAYRPNVWVNSELAGKQLGYIYGIDELETFYYTFTVGDPDAMCQTVWLDLDNPRAGEIAPTYCDVSAEGGFDVKVIDVQWSESMLENGAFKGSTQYSAYVNLMLLTEDNPGAFFGLKQIYSYGANGTVMSQSGSVALVRFDFPATGALTDYLFANPSRLELVIDSDYKPEELTGNRVTVKNAGTSTLSDIQIVPANDGDRAYLTIGAPSKTTLKPGETLTFRVFAAEGLPEGIYDIPYRIAYTSSVNGLPVVQDGSSVVLLAMDAGMGGYALGDINRDGVVDVSDATMAQMYAAALVTLDSEQLALGDISGDGIVDVADATLIQMMAAGIPIGKG